MFGVSDTNPLVSAIQNSISNNTMLLVANRTPFIQITFQFQASIHTSHVRKFTARYSTPEYCNSNCSYKISNNERSATGRGWWKVIISCRAIIKSQPRPSDIALEKYITARVAASWAEIYVGPTLREFVMAIVVRGNDIKNIKYRFWDVKNKIIHTRNRFKWHRHFNLCSLLFIVTRTQ